MVQHTRNRALQKEMRRADLFRRVGGCRSNHQWIDAESPAAEVVALRNHNLHAPYVHPSGETANPTLAKAEK